MNIETTKTIVKCTTCGHTYKVFTCNLKVKDCKNCPSGKVVEVK